jgi:hypothetical protein
MVCVLERVVQLDDPARVVFSSRSGRSEQVSFRSDVTLLTYTNK